MPEMIYQINKNGDTADEIPYYLKRILVKQVLNIYSTEIDGNSDSS